MPLEGVDPQLLDLSTGAIKKARGLHDLLQEERIGVVDQHQIHLAVRVQRLEIVKESGVFAERKRGSIQQHRKVHVAPRMGAPTDRGPKLEQQPNSVPPGDLLQARFLHLLFSGDIITETKKRVAASAATLLRMKHLTTPPGPLTLPSPPTWGRGGKCPQPAPLKRPSPLLL